MSAALLRFETPFPIAGEGVSLLFSNKACAELQKKFGEKWFTGCFARWDAFDVDYFKTCIEAGCVKDGKPFKVAFDEINAPLIKICEPVVDALFICVHGMNFADYLQDQAKRSDLLKSGGGLEDDLPPALPPENS